MPKQTPKIIVTNSLKTLVLSITVAASISGGPAIVHADQYDEQIKALNAQNQVAQGLVNGLAAQAGSYLQTINQLQIQINAMQAALSANQTQQAATQQKITENQNKITQERAYLADDIKTMYTDGQLSTIEELATSKNLSDYVDKQTYRTSVQNKINTTIKEIAALQAQLQKQKAELDVLIASEQQQNAQLATAQTQQQQLLNYNQGQQAAFNQQISANSGRIAQLRQAQIAANARFIGGGSSGAAGTGSTCGGGYPAKWCEIPQDSVIDSWGMYNRECVSYTAFRVAASGRTMPYWGGSGNANQWVADAQGAGIPVDHSPRVGDVAISLAGAYGHAMYVEGVNADGTINISQYNAALNGRYSTRSGLSPSGLYFIHFQ